MTIWETNDRQGRKWFSKRPKLVYMHGIFVGKPCRAPKKGDRVIRKFLVSVEAPRPGWPYPEDWNHPKKLWTR